MVPIAVHLPALADSKGLAKTRERFLTAEPVRPSDVREPILASWWRSREWKVAADRVMLPYVRDPDLDTPLTRNAMPVLRNLRAAPGGAADQRHPHRRRGRRAHQDDRGPRPGTPPRRGPARPGLQLRRGVRGHQRDRHRPGGRPARGRVRPRALRRGPGRPGLRRGPDPRPDLREGRRGGRPDLLAQGRRPAAHRAGQDHRGPDHPGHARGQQRPGAPAHAGVHAGLPAHQRDRAGPEQRRRHDERVRPPGTRPGRPGRAARPGRRDAGQPAGGRGVRRAAQRDPGPDVLPAGPGRRSRRGRGRAREADRAGQPAPRRGLRPQAPHVPARPGRRRCALAARLPAGRDPCTTRANGSPSRASRGWAS